MHKSMGLGDGMSVMCNGLDSVLMPHVLNGTLTSSTLLYNLSWGCPRKSGRAHTVVTCSWGLLCCSGHSGFSLGQRGLLNHHLDHHPLSHLPHPLGHYWMIQPTSLDRRRTKYAGQHVSYYSLGRSLSACCFEWEDYQPVCIDGPGGVRAGRQTSVGCCMVKIAGRKKENKRMNKPALTMVNHAVLTVVGKLSNHTGNI